MGTREKMAVLILLTLIVGDLIYFTDRAYTAVTKPAATYGGEYREGILGQPRLLNPIVAATSADQGLVRLIYSGLYKYDESGNLIPDLAEELPTISDDQKRYTVRLREGALWHDGRSLTAGDIVFTVQLLQDPDYNSPLRGTWRNTQVEKNGDYTVIFSNKDITAPFIHNLTLPIMPEHIWKHISNANFLLASENLEAVGSGPYSLSEIKKLPSGDIEHIKLESFSNYYSGKPYISSITAVFYDTYEDMVEGLQAKAIDGFGYVSVDTQLTVDTNKYNLQLSHFTLPQYQAVFFNIKHPVLGDSSVRMALQVATDIPAILEAVYYNAGKALGGPILPEQLHETNNKQPPAADLASSASMLEVSGWKVNTTTGIRTKGKTPLAFTLTTNDLPSNAKAASMLVDQWKKLNIMVQLNIVSTKDLADDYLRPRTFDALLFAAKLSPDPDPFLFWHSSQVKDPGLNVTQFSNPEVDKLISEARNTTNQESRIPKYKQIQDIISKEHPAIFLNQTTFIYAISKQVQGMRLTDMFDPAYRFFDAPHWYIEEKRVLK